MVTGGGGGDSCRVMDGHFTPQFYMYNSIKWNRFLYVGWVANVAKFMDDDDKMKWVWWRNLYVHMQLDRLGLNAGQLFGMRNWFMTIYDDCDDLYFLFDRTNLIINWVSKH